jgi:predicted nuclease of predicted toxin-antitoxin system
VDEKLGPALRRYGHDVLTVREVGRRGRRDEEQLKYAASAGRALLSHNIADFARLHERWGAQGREHWGILLTEEVDFRNLLRRMLQALDRYSADEAKNRVIFL